MTNTGVPQGCCLSPLLFAVYTDSLSTHYENVYIIKYADDTAIVGLCNNKYPQRIANYHAVIAETVTWCETNFLFINKSKTKELIVDFRSVQMHDPVIVNDSQIEVVSEFKYLGLTFNDTLTWDSHIGSVLAKSKQRLYCIYRLGGFGLEYEKQFWLFRSMVFSLMVYCAPVWLSSCFKTQLNLINRHFRKFVSIEDQYVDKIVLDYAEGILTDPDHPLHKYYSIPRRLYTLPRMRTERFRHSFLPRSIKLLNCNITR